MNRRIKIDILGLIMVTATIFWMALTMTAKSHLLIMDKPQIIASISHVKRGTLNPLAPLSLSEKSVWEYVEVVLSDGEKRRIQVVPKTAELFRTVKIEKVGEDMVLKFNTGRQMILPSDSL